MLWPFAKSRKCHGSGAWWEWDCQLWWFLVNGDFVIGSRSTQETTSLCMFLCRSISGRSILKLLVWQQSRLLLFWSLAAYLQDTLCISGRFSVPWLSWMETIASFLTVRWLLWPSSFAKIVTRLPHFLSVEGPTTCSSSPARSCSSCLWFFLWSSPAPATAPPLVECFPQVIPPPDWKLWLAHQGLPPNASCLLDSCGFPDCVVFHLHLGGALHACPFPLFFLSLWLDSCSLWFCPQLRLKTNLVSTLNGKSKSGTAGDSGSHKLGDPVSIWIIFQTRRQWVLCLEATVLVTVPSYTISEIKEYIFGSICKF